MSIKCDVLVVGAGPAGSSTARATAKKGLKTILIEEDNEIGSPVQCAEGIGSYLFPYMPFKIPKKQLKWKIDGMYFWANNIAVKKEGGIWSGYSINRKEWDQWLASLALKQGAKIITKTKLTSLELRDNNEVEKAIAKSNGNIIEFKPKYLVGADGVNSTVIDCLDTRKKDSIGHVKSYEMKNLKLKYPRYEQLFFGEFAPRVYGYIFPLSETTANVGVGTLYEKENLDDSFDKFINISCIKKQISEGAVVTEKSGSAPIRASCTQLVSENVFLVGDAANQNIKPFIEGNISGIICGDVLGNFIFDVYLGVDAPQNYEDIIKQKFNLIEDSQIYSDIIYGENNIEDKIFNFIILGLMSEIITPDEKEIDYFVEKGYDFLRGYIIKNGGFIEK